MGRHRLINTVPSGALTLTLSHKERELDLRLQGVSDAFVFQEHHHQSNP